LPVILTKVLVDQSSFIAVKVMMALGGVVYSVCGEADEQQPGEGWPNWLIIATDGLMWPMH